MKSLKHMTKQFSILTIFGVSFTLTSYCTYHLFKKFLRRLTVKSLRSFFLLHPFVFFLSPSILLQKTCFLHQCNLKFSILSLRKTFVCLYGRGAAVTMRRNTLWRIQSTMDREVNVKKIWYTKTTKIRTTLCQNISD